MLQCAMTCSNPKFQEQQQLIGERLDCVFPFCDSISCKPTFLLNSGTVLAARGFKIQPDWLESCLYREEHIPQQTQNRRIALHDERLGG